jgi:hypothetical protein
VARSAIARSGVQHKANRAAAQYLFLKNWIPDLRGGFATACPGHEADVIFAETSSMGADVRYALVGGAIDVTYAPNVMYAPRHLR